MFRHKIVKKFEGKKVDQVEQVDRSENKIHAETLHVIDDRNHSNRDTHRENKYNYVENRKQYTSSFFLLPAIAVSQLLNKNKIKI